jgi:hypothetical protein
MFLINCATVNKQLLPDYNGKKPTIKSAKIPSGIDDLLWYSENSIYLYNDFRKNDEKATVYSLDVTNGNITKLNGNDKSVALSKKHELKSLIENKDGNIIVRGAKTLGGIIKSTVMGTRYNDGEGKGKLTSLDGNKVIEFNYKLEHETAKESGKEVDYYYYTIENDQTSSEIGCRQSEGLYTLNLWYLSSNGRFLIAGNNFCDLSKTKKPLPMYSWYGWAAPNPGWDKIAIVKTSTFWLFTFKKLHITKLQTPA